MNVALVDDHQLVRAGLKALIENMDDFDVVAETDDGESVLPLLRSHSVDILVIDLSLKNVHGLDVIPEIRSVYPELPILVLSMHATKDMVRKALRAGATGYLVKDSAESELEFALNSLKNGYQFLSPRVATCVISSAVSPDTTSVGNEPSDKLTERQLEILKMIANGKATKEIAYELALSSKTVEAHRSRIMARLNIRELAGLVRYAIENKLID